MRDHVQENVAEVGSTHPALWYGCRRCMLHANHSSWHLWCSRHIGTVSTNTLTVGAAVGTIIVGTESLQK